MIVLVGRPIPFTLWTPFAYLWQDAVIAVLFLLFARLVRRDWMTRAVYAGLVSLAALTVPVARVLSSPLTASMLRAARGTLSDSIRYHLTPANLIGTLIVIAVGIAVPILWRRPLRGARIWAAAAIACILIGPFAARRTDTNGLERNPVTALVQTSLPRVRGMAHNEDWRATLSPSDTIDDLSRLRGAARGRNVLLVVLESTGAGYLRPYGAKEDPTPNFTALAGRSIVFDHAYAVYPESVKGLVTYLASRYPGFDVPAERHAAIASPSLATELNAAGYASALFHSGRFMYLGMDTILAGSGFTRLEDAGDIGGNRNSSFGIDEPAAVRRILQWVDSLPRGRPFLAAYLPIAGHHPYAYAEPGPFPEEEEIDRYRSALYDGDRALGTLLAGLRVRGLADSTLIVAIGDHGEAFGQHSGNYGHTLAIYEENVRVPFTIFVPGAENAALRVRRTASLLDVAPTILDLLGLDAPPVFQGVSLLDPQPRMSLFFTDYSLGLLGLRDGCTKYIHEMESGRSRIFDLCRDPGEQVDLADDRAAEVTRYRDRLRRWIAAEVARVGGSG